VRRIQPRPVLAPTRATHHAAQPTTSRTHPHGLRAARAASSSGANSGASETTDSPGAQRALHAGALDRADACACTSAPQPVLRMFVFVLAPANGHGAHPASTLQSGAPQTSLARAPPARASAAAASSSWTSAPPRGAHVGSPPPPSSACTGGGDAKSARTPPPAWPRRTAPRRRRRLASPERTRSPRKMLPSTSTGAGGSGVGARQAPWMTTTVGRGGERDLEGERERERTRTRLGDSGCE
jgi:hypothetical protein